MYTFHDNPLSNSYMIRQNYPIGDKFFRFAIRCRANLLGTPEFNELIHGAVHTPCPRCLNQGDSHTQSLSHILNGCIYSYRLYTERHNRIQNVLIEYLKENPDIQEIYEDKSINIIDIPDNLKRLRPDIVTWSNNRNKCLIIEISVPYGKKNYDEDTLSDVYLHKKEKYSEIVSFLRDRNIDVTFCVVIVSSIGAVFKESINDINRIIKNKKQAKSAIRRISANAILGSLKIWNNRFSDTNTVTQSCSNHQSEPIDLDDSTNDVLFSDLELL